MTYLKKSTTISHMEILDKLIIDVVEQKEGCKLMELIVGLSDIIKNENLTNIKFEDHLEYVKLINLIQQSISDQTNIIYDKVINLIKTGNLVGISYNLKSKTYSDKIFILPKGTGFKYILKNKTEE